MAAEGLAGREFGPANGALVNLNGFVGGGGQFQGETNCGGGIVVLLLGGINVVFGLLVAGSVSAQGLE